MFPKLRNETGIADYLHNVVSISVIFTFFSTFFFVQCCSFYCYTIFSSLLDLSVNFLDIYIDFFLLLKKPTKQQTKKTQPQNREQTTSPQTLLFC